MLRRLSAASLVVALSIAAFVSTAGAHVTVNPSTAPQGGFSQLTFRVPNERPDASTVGLRVQFPKDHPIPFVSVRPVPGWTIEFTKAPLDDPMTVEGETVREVVTEVAWRGGTIAPGEYQNFDVSAGPLPATPTLTFKALQTYSSGEEVAWIDTEGPDGTEPEHPAPVLKLSAAGSGGGTTTTTAAPVATTAPAAGTAATDTSSSDTLAVIGIALAVVALALAGVAVARSARGPAPG